jgi:hypothetical protein
MLKSRTILGLCIVAAGLAGAGHIASAQKSTGAKVPKSACNAIGEEAKCKADTKCSWVAALVDSKTGKQKRKAYCRTKSAAPKKTEKK